MKNWNGMVSPLKIGCLRKIFKIFNIKKGKLPKIFSDLIDNTERGDVWTHKNFDSKIYFFKKYINLFSRIGSRLDII